MSESRFESRSLSFNSSQDAIDFASQGVEESRRWLAARNLTIAQRYKDGDICHWMQLGLIPGPYPQHLNFLLFAIPPKESKIADWATSFDLQISKPLAIQQDAVHVGVNIKDDSVLVRPTQLGQCVEHIIPSAIWLESLESRDEIRADSLAVVFDDSVNIRSRLREGKVIVSLSGAELYCGAVDGLVKHMPDVVKGIGGKHAEFIRQIGNDSILKDTLRCLRIDLFKWEAKASFVKVPPLPVKTVNIFPCAA